MLGPARGFTLIETLAAVAALGIVIGLASSSWHNAVLDARQVEARSLLAETLLRAGTEAIAAGRHVVICPSHDGAGCADGGTDWSRGWIAFVDRTSNRTLDSDEPVFVRHALSGQIRITSSIGRTRVVYQPNGAPPGSNLTFLLCDSRGPAHAGAVIMGNSGRWRHTLAPKKLAADCIGY